MAESKVVIKINYDKEKGRQAITEPKVVTVWHVRRILTALVILALIVIMLIFWLGGDETRNTTDSRDQARSVETHTGVAPIKEPDVAVQPEIIDHASETVKKGVKKIEPVSAKANRPAAIIFDKKVIRASLNSALKDNEPYEQVKLPIRLAKNQTIELFYFNELRDIKDRNLYHHWWKDGKSVYKKQLDVSAGRTKAVTSKTLSYKDKGEWRIELVDSKGKVFSEVNFAVNSE